MTLPTYFETTEEVKNPAGDHRCDRAHWRSQLEKGKIVKGFRWYLMDDGETIASARGSAMVARHAKGHDALLTRLRAVSREVPAEVGDVLARHAYDHRWAVIAVCKARGVTPAELDAILTAAALEDDTDA